MVKYKEEEKLAIYTTEDVYALGVLIMEVLVGPKSVLNYVTYLNQFTDHCLYTVRIPTSCIDSRSAPLFELNRDHGRVCESGFMSRDLRYHQRLP